MFKSLLTALLLVWGASAAHADRPPGPAKLTPAQLLAALNFQQGQITLPDGSATLDLPASSSAT